MDKCLFATGKDDWETPIDFFNELNKEFRFTLDPCCTAETAKCNKYYTRSDNGLEKDWGGDCILQSSI